MAYGRDPYAHLSGVGTIASASPRAVARARQQRAVTAARMANHDRLKVRLATGRVALGYTPPKDLDGGTTGSGAGGGGGYHGAPPVAQPTGIARFFGAGTTQTVAGRSPTRTFGGVPVPVYPSPGSTVPGTTTAGATSSASPASPSSGGVDPGGGIPLPDTGPDGMPTDTTMAPPSSSSIMDTLSAMSTGQKLLIAGGAAAALYLIFRKRGA